VATGDMSEDELLLKAFDVLKRKTERLQNLVDEHLEHLSVDEWRALNHLYLTHAQKAHLGQMASFLARCEGIAPRQESRKLSLNANGLNVLVNVYPRAILSQAAKDIGIQAKQLLN